MHARKQPSISVDKTLSTSSSIPEFAARHGLGISTVWKLIAAGKIQVTRMTPRVTRITYEAEQEFLKAHTIR
jgi:hypothetical protein